MKKTISRIDPKVSLSLASLLSSATRKLPRAAAARSVDSVGNEAGRSTRGELVSVLIDTSDADAVVNSVEAERPEEAVEKLTDGIVSAHLALETVQRVTELGIVERVQTKKRSQPHLTLARQDIHLTAKPGGSRLVPETGKDVLLGIIDSGFDLTHPMFLDAEGKPRIAGLLVQNPDSTQKEFSEADVSAAIASGADPCSDPQGHGTHVASIAGGSLHRRFEGIAPGARFLLVKTNFLDTDRATHWVFQKAKNRPCVINMSLGHHFGAHDGTDVEERLHGALTGPGKLIVISAGNERNDSIHIGGLFYSTESQTVAFDILRPADSSDRPAAVLTLWYDERDNFDIRLISTTGGVYKVPNIGSEHQFASSALVVDLLRQKYPHNGLIQAQLQVRFSREDVPNRRLRGWRLAITCKKAVIGRIDGWFNNSGFATFQGHPMVETARTVGLPATGRSCIAVASHISKDAWKSDLSDETDIRAVVGRSSPFSSLGPSRDGRRKPDISAPGQYITAALANLSELASLDERVLKDDRLVTIEGTSMAAPIVTGVIALLLQKKPKLKLDDAVRAITASARRDAQTSAADWTPTYGAGKIDIKSALERI